MVTLDSYTDSIPKNWKIGAVKMDCEGYEYYIFKGGKKFFSTYKIPYIIMEFEPMFFNRLKYSITDAIKAI